MADDLRTLLGRATLDGALLRRARGERRLAGHRDAQRVAGAAPPDRPGLRPDLVLRGDDRMGPAAGGVAGLHRRPPPRRRRAAPGGALAARRLLAQLPGALPRGERPAQGDASDLRQGRRHAGRAGPGARPRPPLPGPVERRLLARGLRRHLHHAPAPRRLGAPGRGGGCRRRRRTRAGRRRGRDAARRRRPRRRRGGPRDDALAARRDRRRRGSRIGRVGPAGGVARHRRGDAPPARGGARPAPRPRGGGSRRRLATPPERSRRHQHPRTGGGQGAGTRRAAPLRPA